MTNKKHATFDQLIADSKPETREVDCDGHTILVQALSGKERFELATLTEMDRWQLLVWVCMRGMIDPKPNKESYLDKLKPEWVVKIATSITDLSGIGGEALEEAGEESANVTDIGGS